MYECVFVSKFSCKILYYAFRRGRLNTSPGPRTCTVTSIMLQVVKLSDSWLTPKLLCAHTLSHLKLE